MTNIEYIRIGVIIGVHGLNGRLKVYITSDNPERFKVGSTVLLDRNSNFEKYTIAEFKPYKDKTALIILNGIHDRDTAFALKKTDICITKEEAVNTLDLENDTFYYFDLIGCTVYLDNKVFGTVDNIMEAGSGEILEIIDESGKKHLVPFVESMVNTDLVSEKRIDIYPPEGLFDI